MGQIAGDGPGGNNIFMGNVSILFSEKEKLYTLYEVSALTGLSIREIQNFVKRGEIKEVVWREKNNARELIVPLNCMELYVRPACV